MYTSYQYKETAIYIYWQFRSFDSQIKEHNPIELEKEKHRISQWGNQQCRPFNIEPIVSYVSPTLRRKSKGRLPA